MKKKVLLVTVISFVIILAALISIVLINGKGEDLYQTAFGGKFLPQKLPEATLTFHMPNNTDAEPKYTREVLDAIQKKTKNSLNIKLDFKFHTWDKYGDQLKAAIASDEPCDFFILDNTSMDSYISLAREGLLKDIKDLLPKYAQTYYHKFYPSELSAAMVDGKLVALPRRNASCYRPCAIVRKDLMKKYNIPDIKGYDDYEAYLKTIKENETGIYPLAAYGSQIQLFSAIYGYSVLDSNLGLVYKADDTDMKIKAWEQTPEFRQSVCTVNDWIKKGYLTTDVVITWPDDLIITSGKFASFIGTQGSEEYYNNILKRTGAADWSYKEYPLYPELTAQRADPMEGAIGFSEKSPNTERALMFTEWVESSQENYDMLMYGIKDKNYILKGNSISLPSGQEMVDTYYTWVWRDPFYNTDYERIMSGGSADFKRNLMNDYEKHSKYPLHVGFAIDRVSLGDLASSRLSKIIVDFETSLRSGTFTENKMNDFINSSTDKSVSTLVTQVQQQLDAWKASRH